jgi:hypothetical protein
MMKKFKSWRAKIYCEEIHGFIWSPSDQISKNEMGGACSTCGGKEESLLGFGGKTLRNESLGRARCGWEDNIKMCIKGTGLEDVDFIDLIQDRENWRAVASWPMSRRVL